MSITIKAVTSAKDFKTFARFANKMYKGNKYYVPSMPLDDLATFSKDKNAAFEFSEAEFYLAYKNGEVVGRVAAIIITARTTDNNFFIVLSPLYFLTIYIIHTTYYKPLTNIPKKPIFLNFPLKTFFRFF